MNRLAFEVAENDGVLAITPAIDGIVLSTVVADFERDKGYVDPAGATAGSSPTSFPTVRWEQTFVVRPGTKARASETKKSTSSRVNAVKSVAGR